MFVDKSKSELENISVAGFKNFGKDQIGYVRPIYAHGTIVYGLFNADGEELSVFPDEKTAKTAAWQGELLAMTVH